MAHTFISVSSNTTAMMRSCVVLSIVSLLIEYAEIVSIGVFKIEIPSDLTSTAHHVVVVGASLCYIYYMILLSRDTLKAQLDEYANFVIAAQSEIRFCIDDIKYLINRLNYMKSSSKDDFAQKQEMSLKNIEDFSQKINDQLKMFSLFEKTDFVVMKIVIPTGFVFIALVDWIIY